MTSDIPNFEFDGKSLKLNFDNMPRPAEAFLALWTDDIMDLLGFRNYGKKIGKAHRPHLKNSRFSTFAETNKLELIEFLGICLLPGLHKCNVWASF